MPDLVIVACRPKPGRADDLARLARAHHARLAPLGLVTDRAAVPMRAGVGTVIEAFEWKDGATGRAQAMPQAQALWAEYPEVSDYIPLSGLSETSEVFATFTPL